MELHFWVGDAQLEKSWMGRIQCSGGGSLPGKPFSYGFILFDAAPKVFLERKNKRTLFPKLIVQLGLPIFLSLMGVCMRGVWDCKHHRQKVFVYG